MLFYFMIISLIKANIIIPFTKKFLDLNVPNVHPEKFSQKIHIDNYKTRCLIIYSMCLEFKVYNKVLNFGRFKDYKKIIVNR